METKPEDYVDVVKDAIILPEPILPLGWLHSSEMVFLLVLVAFIAFNCLLFARVKFRKGFMIGLVSSGSIAICLCAAFVVGVINSEAVKSQWYEELSDFGFSYEDVRLAKEQNLFDVVSEGSVSTIQHEDSSRHKIEIDGRVAQIYTMKLNLTDDVLGRIEDALSEVEEPGLKAFLEQQEPEEQYMLLSELSAYF